jgi:mono/diheme cytochrome c family protein
MQIRRFIAVVIALSVLALGVLSACGGGADEAGTINQDITIGTGTEATPVEGGDAGTAESVEEATPVEGGATTAAAEGDAAAGEAIFASAGCAGCHTLAAAGANGAVGPNLDDLKPSYDQVLSIVTNGRGAMPAYSGQLSEADIQNVSAYVAQNAGQ